MACTILVTGRRPQAYHDASAKAWLISCLLHSAIVGLILPLAKPTQLPRPLDPFRWEVSLLSADPSPSEVPSAQNEQSAVPVAG